MRVEVTQEKYEKYSKQGMKDSLISKRLGVSQATLIYHKKKWYGGDAK